MSKIRVLLIEDNRLLREGITVMLNDQPDIRAVSSAGTNGDFIKTISKAVRQRPHVVLLDIGLKNQNSLKLAEQIKKRLPRTEVIVMDLIPVKYDIIEFVKAGISGFIKKDALVDDIVKSIRKVAKGKKVLPPTSESSLITKVVERAVRSGNSNQLVSAVKMTRSEQKVLDLLSQGQSHKEIALKLKIPIFTVNSHMKSVFEKLALYTRLELANFSLTRDGSKKTLATNIQIDH